MPDKDQPSNAADATVRRPSKWIKQAGSEHIAQAEALPLRRDMVTLLTYLHENRVKGTRSTGNLPLKAVREVTARFVNPPELETTLGDYTYRVRSEDDVWPLSFLHTLAYVGRLLEGGPAVDRHARWRAIPGRQPPGSGMDAAYHLVERS